MVVKYDDYYGNGIDDRTSFPLRPSLHPVPLRP
ncbi:MAG: hypothetical protein K0Q79_3426 [Flavipsychrobacter sp.]|jgi:hypothetical protein|nr:hypothetical protein [Flavipsychrobacter sp.]